MKKVFAYLEGDRDRFRAFGKKQQCELSVIRIYFHQIINPQEWMRTRSRDEVRDEIISCRELERRRLVGNFSMPKKTKTVQLSAKETGLFEVILKTSLTKIRKRVGDKVSPARHRSREQLSDLAPSIVTAIERHWEKLSAKEKMGV